MNRTYREDVVGASSSFDEFYSYDGLHRLTNFDRGDLNAGKTAITTSAVKEQDWTLDPTGNWTKFDEKAAGSFTLQQERYHNKVNEIDGNSGDPITLQSGGTGTNWADPAHDNNGNMTTMPQPKDLTKGFTATWDAWNRLVKLTNDADSDKIVAEYEYDGLNRRTIKKTPFLFSGTLTRHYYFSDQWQVLEEVIDNPISSMVVDQQYVWGLRYVDDLVLRDRYDVGPGFDNRLYALQDALFSVVAMTDTTGASIANVDTFLSPCVITLSLSNKPPMDNRSRKPRQEGTTNPTNRTNPTQAMGRRGEVERNRPQVVPTKLGRGCGVFLCREFVGFVRFVVPSFLAVNGCGLPRRIHFDASKPELAAAA